VVRDDDRSLSTLVCESADRTTMTAVDIHQGALVFMASGGRRTIRLLSESRATEITHRPSHGRLSSAAIGVLSTSIDVVMIMRAFTPSFRESIVD
jgi:hypothetical protein